MTTLISFYTKDWEYPQHAKRLAAECEQVGIPHVIEELPSTGSYLKNTCMKPQFILDKLNELKSPVLWVDVDASIYKQFTHPIDGVDFAAKKMAEHRKRTWHVGTMWFDYNPAVLSFIEAWILNTGGLSDESSLEKTWKELGHMITATDLPEEYFHIEKRGLNTPRNAVIMHRISSGLSKLKEMPIAAARRKRGEW